MKDILIATSISPFNVDTQVDFLKTWKGFGSRMLTLNHSSEIEKLSAAQSEFEIIEVERSAKEIVGKPLVFIDDFLKFFLESSHSHLLLINSDLHLRKPDEFKNAINALEFDLFFGQRIDVNDVSDEEGELFGGFDYFIFSRDLAAKIPASEFCIGAPWWDHWIPLASILLDAKVYSCEEPIIGHVLHEVNYGVGSLGYMG